MSAKPHISNTQLSLYFNCAEAYRRRYVEGEKIPPGIALLVGTGTHKGAEHNFRQKIESRSDLPKSDIVEAAVAGFEAETAGGFVLSDEEESRGHKVVIGEAKDLVATLAEVHAEQQAPEYQPVAVEHPYTIEFPGASHDLLTITDLIDDRSRVTDLKTAARRKPQTEVDTSVQLTIYAAAYQLQFGHPPALVQLDTLVKTKKPGRQLLSSTRGPADFQTLLNRINVMLSGVHAGIFPPAPVGHWMCSARWCGYFQSCPYVNHERREAAESE